MWLTTALHLPLDGLFTEPILDLVIGGHRLRIGNNVPGAAEIEAMRQGGTGQIIIDQGGDDADLGQTHPDGEILDPIGHKQGNAVTAHQVLGLGPVGKAIGQGIQLCIGERLAFKPNGRAALKPINRTLEIVADQV